MSNGKRSRSGSLPASRPVKRPRRWASRKGRFAVSSSGRSPRSGGSSGSMRSERPSTGESPFTRAHRRMDDEMQALDIRDFEIERRLDAFARARLTPDPAAVARARARVMREARLQFEAARIAAHVAPVMALASRRSPIRSIATPLLAASLWAGIAIGSVSAAQAGGALYPARIWIESATLPASVAERTAAELGRLDARLADALTGAARGDTRAVAAALAAYDEIAQDTLAVSGGDAGLE